MDKNHEFTIYPQKMAPFGQFQKARFAYFLVQVGIIDRPLFQAENLFKNRLFNPLTGNKLAYQI